jgi:hypothetical protein
MMVVPSARAVARPLDGVMVATVGALLVHKTAVVSGCVLPSL